MVQSEKNIIHEYDVFGPWILKVTEEDPVPSLFLPYYKENQNCLMLIKIPRNIQRRNAKPGMDLYDYVIGMYETYGYILKRIGKEVEEIRFYYDQIESIEDYKVLLSGRLTIHLRNNIITVPYNAVSNEIISEVVKIIRDRYTSKTYKSIPIINEVQISEVTEILYENMIRKMNFHGDVLRVMAFQPVTKINNNNSRLGQKLLGLIRPRLLLSTVHLLSDKELLVINRGKPIKYSSEAIYSYSLVYVPIEKINSIKFDRCEEYNNLQVVSICTSESTFNFHFDEKNGNMIDFYKKLGDIE